MEMSSYPPRSIGSQVRPPLAGNGEEVEFFLFDARISTRGRGQRSLFWCSPASNMHWNHVSEGVGCCICSQGTAGSVRVLGRASGPWWTCMLTRKALRAQPQKRMSERESQELARRRMEQIMTVAPPERYKVVDEQTNRRALKSTQTLTRGWFEADTILGELTSDDGIPVSQLSGRPRTDWFRPAPPRALRRPPATGCTVCLCLQRACILPLRGALHRWDDLITLFNSRVLERISNRMAFTVAWCIAVTAAIQVRGGEGRDVSS
jgi:hypothetical protein